MATDGSLVHLCNAPWTHTDGTGDFVQRTICAGVEVVLATLPYGDVVQLVGPPGDDTHYQWNAASDGLAAEYSYQVHRSLSTSPPVEETTALASQGYPTTTPGDPLPATVSLHSIQVAFTIDEYGWSFGARGYSHAGATICSYERRDDDESFMSVTFYCAGAELFFYAGEDFQLHVINPDFADGKMDAYYFPWRADSGVAFDPAREFVLRDDLTDTPDNLDTVLSSSLILPEIQVDAIALYGGGDGEGVGVGFGEGYGPDDAEGMQRIVAYEDDLCSTVAGTLTVPTGVCVAHFLTREGSLSAIYDASSQSSGASFRAVEAGEDGGLSSAALAAIIAGALCVVAMGCVVAIGCFLAARRGNTAKPTHAAHAAEGRPHQVVRRSSSRRSHGGSRRY
jgi:hypothetical protein